MTKIPSTVIIHKRLDSADTRLMRMKGEIVHNPLEQNLGLFDFGSYHQADPNSPYAFERINQIWQEDIDTDESGDEEEEMSTGDEKEQHQENEGKTSDEETKQPNEEDQTTQRTRQTQNQIKRKRTESANTKGTKIARTMKINRVTTKKQQLQSL
jgi:hypothetical protein